MQPLLTVEYTLQAEHTQCNEESITLDDHEDLWRFVAPGGGCELVPDDVSVIQFIYLNPKQPNTANPIADVHARIQIGRVIFNGPLFQITETTEEIMDKAGRKALSMPFLKMLGALTQHP